MSIFERYLTLWVALCIVAGVAITGDRRVLGDQMSQFLGFVH